MRKGIGKGEWYREVVTMGDINANQPHCVSCNRVGTEFSGKPVESQCFGKNDPGLRWRDSLSPLTWLIGSRTQAKDEIVNNMK